MAVMSEGLGFNLCVTPYLNICVPNLPQGQGQRLLEVVRVGSEVLYWDRWGDTKLEKIVRTKTNENSNSQTQMVLSQDSFLFSLFV